MLTVDNDDRNLGIVRFGEEINFHYVVTNRYTQPLTVTALTVGCHSCTSAAINKNILLPGESTNVSVTFKPGATGMQAKKVSISYTVNGETKPSVEIKFRATVQ